MNASPRSPAFQQSRFEGGRGSCRTAAPVNRGVRLGMSLALPCVKQAVDLESVFGASYYRCFVGQHS